MVFGDVVDGGEIGETALLGVGVTREFHCVARGEDLIV